MTHRWRFAWAWTIGTTLVLLGASCPPQPPTPTPTPPPEQPLPVCAEGQAHSCWHKPGTGWVYACYTPWVDGGVTNVPGGPAACPAAPEPPPPPVEGCVIAGVPTTIIAEHRNQLGSIVNAAMSRLTGCAVGSRCVITVRPQTWQTHVEAELRKGGLCAGQHEPSTDEIVAARVGAGQPWEGFHIYAGDGWDDPTKFGTVVWSPGADRPAYAPPGGAPVPPTPAPSPGPTPVPPAGDACPAEPCPLRLWTRETLPPGWGDNEIGRPAYEMKAIPHTMSNSDASVVVIRQEPFCAATGQSPSADGQPRAACPMRLPGSGKDAEQVAVEAWILFGGFTRDGRNGQDCTPNHTTNPAAFLMGTGNCRMCSANLALRDDPRSCSGWF